MSWSRLPALAAAALSLASVAPSDDDALRWLEDTKSPRTAAYLEGEDAAARRFAASVPQRAGWHEEIARLAHVTVETPPFLRGGREFLAAYAPVGPQTGLTLLVRDRGAAVPRVLVDRARWERERKETPLRFAPSPDGRFLAFGASASGSAWETVRVVDVATGRVLPDEVPDVHTGVLSTIRWTSDSKGFYVVAYPHGTEGRGTRARLVHHRLGASHKDDVVAFDPGADDVSLTAFSSPKSRFLVVAARRGAEPGSRLFVRPLDDPTAPTESLLDRSDAAFSYAGMVGDRAYFRTDLGAPNGRVVSIALAGKERGAIREIVAEEKTPISTWSGFGPTGSVVAGGKLVVTRIEDGRHRVRIHALDGRLEREAPLPWEGSIWSGFVGTEDDPRVFYSLSGLVDPGTTYALDVATGRSSPARAASGEGRTDDVVTETMHVKASDGADIPVFLVRRRGVPRDGTAPAVLYGYGFSGWNASPYFYPAMAAFVRRGGLWAVPVLRGDGGYGTAWHLAGRARNKPRSIADYIDVAEALVQRHDTSKDRLVANGSSAGGPLVAAAAVKRPDLFRAVLLDYPLVDMLRYETAPLARRWVTEYGTVGDPEDLRILRSYSAYQNLVKGACYPAFFLAPGENDGIAPPWHAAKLAAALENVERGSGCSRPVLLRVSWGAGHAAGADLETSVENWTDQMAFLSSVLPAGALPSR